MRAFVCVYLHREPSRSEFAKTEEASDQDPLLARFLKTYKQPGSFWDWGDDPSFFAATEILKDVRAASWGVCRRDVRAVLGPDDFIVWFCARRDAARLLYFFIGVTTVFWTISRKQLWSDNQFSAYRKFYNTLAKPVDGKLVQVETFHRFHSDWRNRAGAPYIIFDPAPKKTAVNVTAPLLVAEKLQDQPLEIWSRNPHRAQRLRTSLFDDLGIGRRLRTRNRQQPHRHIALHRAPRLKGQTEQLDGLRAKLLDLVF
jgi:hypothetical protein